MLSDKERDAMTKERKVYRQTMLDHLPDESLWPAKFRFLFYKPHLNNREKWEITVFFASFGGVAPQLLANWVRSQPGVLRHAQSAVEMADLIKRWGKGQLHMSGKYEDNYKIMTFRDNSGKLQTKHFHYDMDTEIADTTYFGRELGLYMNELAKNSDADNTFFGQMPYVEGGFKPWQDASDDLLIYATHLPREKGYPKAEHYRLAADHALKCIICYKPLKKNWSICTACLEPQPFL